MTQDLNIFELDKNYSTTRRVTKQKPVIENKPEDKVKTQLFLPAKPDRKGEGGLRTQGYFKHSEPDQPLISVITVVFNGEKYLEQTIQSVINQTYDNVEYIIIDGGSTDGTLDIIRKYEGMVDYWVSEKDEGIYDAMNKGLGMFSGEWVNFMNAGDIFEASVILEDISQMNLDDYAIIYGAVRLIYPDFNKIVQPGSIQSLWKGMQFSHQSILCKKDYILMFPFDLKYKIAADFKQIYKIYLYKNGSGFLNLNFVISKIIQQGISSSNQVDCVLEYYDIVVNINNGWLIHYYYAIKLFNRFITQYLKSIIPKNMISYFQKILNTPTSINKKYNN